MHSGGYESSSSTSGLVLMLGVAVVLTAMFCARRQHDMVPMMAYDMHGKPVAYGAPVPMGCAMPNGPPAYPMYHGGCGGYGGGYSGMAVAGGAATGFLGGMMLSDVRPA